MKIQLKEGWIYCDMEAQFGNHWIFSEHKPSHAETFLADQREFVTATPKRIFYTEADNAEICPR